jgi:hypothetical protein
MILRKIFLEDTQYISLKMKNTLETLSLSIIDKGLKQNSISFCIAKKKIKQVSLLRFITYSSCSMNFLFDNYLQKKRNNNSKFSEIMEMGKKCDTVQINFLREWNEFNYKIVCIGNCLILKYHLL